MTVKYLSEGDVRQLLQEIEREAIFGTVDLGDALTWHRIDEKLLEKLSLRAARSPVSPKAVFVPLREKVAVYPGGSASVEPEAPKQAVLGARACDLRALTLLDKVLLEGDYTDPFYQARREATTVISVDCIECAESCFCTLLGDSPYPEKGFDLNLSPVEGGYIIEPGSEKGEHIIKKSERFLVEPSERYTKERERNRKAIEEKLAAQNARWSFEKPVAEIVKGALDSPKWQALTSKCVECGACANVCPTCHCFLLYDQVSDAGEGINERIKAWDSCLYGDYSRMAGVGGVKPNPRPMLRSRIENRFMHKFAYMPKNYQLLGCVGCGRCSDACLGGEDIRDILSELAK